MSGTNTNVNKDGDNIVCTSWNTDRESNIIQNAKKRVQTDGQTSVSTQYKTFGFTKIKCDKYRAFHNVIRDLKKNYYRKTVGHVFTKPVQIEGTQKNFPQ